MKIVYICSTAAIIYTIRYQEPIKTTYDKSQDSFLHWKFAAAPSAVGAIIIHLIGSGFSGFGVQELLWTFSIILESIAILPQLVVLQRYGEVENLTGNYVFFLGAYRALYILNWIYRSQVEAHYRHHWLTYICGIIQTILYGDFFYYYVKRSVAVVLVRWLDKHLMIHHSSYFVSFCFFRFLSSSQQEKGRKVFIANNEIKEERDLASTEEGVDARRSSSDTHYNQHPFNTQIKF